MDNTNSGSISGRRRQNFNTIKYTMSSSSSTLNSKLNELLQNNYFKVYSCFITILGLLLNDIQILTSKSNDEYFDIIHIIMSVLIFLEIVLYFIGDVDYGFSLFFLCDVIFLISLILGIAKLYDSIIYYEYFNDIKTNSDMNWFIKFTKIIRIIKIVRIGKIIAIFNSSFTKRKHSKDEIDDIKSNNGSICSTLIDFSSFKIFIFFVLLIISLIVFDQEF